MNGITDMSRIHKDTDYEAPYDEQILRIKPEGWTQSIEFKYGHKHMCGQAEDGVSVNIEGEAGGVMTLDDLIALRDMVNQHLADVLYRKPYVELPPEDEEEIE